MLTYQCYHEYHMPSATSSSGIFLCSLASTCWSGDRPTLELKATQWQLQTGVVASSSRGLRIPVNAAYVSPQQGTGRFGDRHDPSPAVVHVNKSVGESPVCLFIIPG